MSAKVKLTYRPDVDYDALPVIQKEIIQALIDLGGEATHEEIFAHINKQGRIYIGDEDPVLQ